MENTTVFTPDAAERKRILKSLQRNDRRWRTMTILAILLVTILIPVLINAIRLFWPTFAKLTWIGKTIALLFAFLLACIVMLACHALADRLEYKCTWPYSSIIKGTMSFPNGEALKYAFRRRCKWKEARQDGCDDRRDCYTYIIRREDVQRVVFERGLCKIYGNALLLQPTQTLECDDDLGSTTRVKEFSFPMAFQQKHADQAIADWLIEAGKEDLIE